jgi:glycosyltransferase involved in cell wall biosynthesis
MADLVRGRSSGISVLICVLDGERTIGPALESVLDQTLAPEAVIVVDGQSSDRTRAVVSRFDGVRLLDQSGIGLGQARNQGIDAAGTELVGFLDADDIWHPRKLEQQISILENDDRAVGIIGLLERFDWDSNGDGALPEQTFGRAQAHTPGCLLARKSAFEEIGEFRADLRYCADHEWFIRAGRHKGMIRMEPVVWLYKGMHGDNLSHNREAYRKELVRVAHEHIALSKHR